MASKPPDAFLSYTRFDDERGKIRQFRQELEYEVRAVTGEQFVIFQDVDGIGLGEYWPGKLDEMLSQACFFIPILTPSYFNSKPCRDELNKFAEHEQRAGRKDLILPIYWRDFEALENTTDPLATLIASRQPFDWRGLRDRLLSNQRIRRALETLAKRIAAARRRVDEPRQRGSGLPEFTYPYVDEPQTIRDNAAPWCPEMVVVQPGEFLMGSPESDLEAYADEKPQHLVRIGYALAVGRYPVTFEEYDHFAEATQREPPDAETWGRHRRPVINVSWKDAKAYVGWLAAQTGQPYRLLSEAEWEYACRAGTTSRYWWGDDFSKGSTGYYPGKTARATEVGSYHPNPFGLYDTHGNVWEWVEDIWHDSYKNAPANGSSWFSGSDARRVVRGGCWTSEPVDLRAACRLGIDAADRLDIVGFRIARIL